MVWWRPSSRNVPFAVAQSWWFCDVRSGWDHEHIPWILYETPRIEMYRLTSHCSTSHGIIVHLINFLVFIRVSSQFWIIPNSIALLIHVSATSPQSPWKNTWLSKKSRDEPSMASGSSRCRSGGIWRDMKWPNMEETQIWIYSWAVDHGGGYQVTISIIIINIYTIG